MTVAQCTDMNAQAMSLFMGLESYLSETTMLETHYQRRAITSDILSEQERQLREGIYDPDSMTDVLVAASDWAMKQSQIITLLHSDER